MPDKSPACLAYGPEVERLGKRHRNLAAPDTDVRGWSTTDLDLYV